MRSLGSLLRRSVGRFGDRPALQGCGAALSYRDLLERAERGASHLQARGLRPGDRVLLHLDARPEWAAALFAILDAGCVAVPLPDGTPPEAVAAVAALAEPRATVGRGGIPPEALFFGPRAAPAPHPLALLAFTSGSTSRPRAVELTHENLLSDLDALLRVVSCAPGDAFLSMLPPAHLFELVGGLLGPLSCGARVVYPGALLPNRLLDALRESSITHALAVPALVEALHRELLDRLVSARVVGKRRRGQGPAASAEALRTARRTGRVRRAVRARIGPAFRTLVVGGAALDPAFAAIAEAFGIRLEVGYGLTEAGPIVSVGAWGEAPAGSVGRPLPGVDVRIDATGEILVRGPNVTRGYHRDPAATADALRDGWLRTGDRGRLDGAGFLHVTGRIKEAIVTATGETVYPDEVEPWYESPLFAEWCVAALPGPNGNDRMALFVVPAAPDAPLDEAFAELRARAPARCRAERLVRLARPLPRTATGKVRRALLAREAVA